MKAAFEESGMTVADVWLRYFAMGGVAPPEDVETHLAGVVVLSSFEHDVLAHAINEWFTERDADHPVPYLRGDDGPEVTL